jgi:hypothetical protein
MPAWPSFSYRLVCRVIAELKGRFEYFMKTGDDSKMPSDIIGAIFTTVRAHHPVSGWDAFVDDRSPIQAVRFGGREEYEFMKKIHDKPKNPMQKTCAMYVRVSGPQRLLNFLSAKLLGLPGTLSGRRRRSSSPSIMDVTR